MARKKTVLQGLSIGPDVELVLLVAGGAFALYWLWNSYGSNAVSSLESDVSGGLTDVENAFSNATG